RACGYRPRHKCPSLAPSRGKLRTTCGRRTTMSALRDFVAHIRTKMRGGSLGEPVDKSKPSAPLAAPTPSADHNSAVTKRLAALVGPYKEAGSLGGPAAAKMQSLMAAVKQHITQQDFQQAAKVLDDLEPLIGQFKVRDLQSFVSNGATQAAASAGSAPSTAGAITAGETVERDRK